MRREDFSPSWGGASGAANAGVVAAAHSRPRLNTPPPSTSDEDEEDYFEDEFGGVDSAVYSEPVFLHETARVASMGAASDISDLGMISDAASSVISRVAQSEGGWNLHGGGRRRRRRSLPTVQYRTSRTTSTGLLGWRRRETVVDAGSLVRLPSG